MYHAVVHRTGPALLRRSKRGMSRAVAMFGGHQLAHTGAIRAAPPTWRDVVASFAIFVLLALALIAIATLGHSLSVEPGLGLAFAGAIGTSKSSEKTVKQVVHRADVKKHGEALIVPETMSYDAAIQILNDRKKAEEEAIGINKVMRVYPWEGARAFRMATERMFGLQAQGLTQYSFFGPTPPQEIAVDVGVGKTETVPWGKFGFVGAETLPSPHSGTEYLVMGVQMLPEFGMAFQVSGVIKRKHKDMIDRVLALTEELAVTHSIYRGQAIRMEFRNRQDGDLLPYPTIKFLDLTKVKPEEAIFNQDIEDVLRANIYGHITARHELAKLGVPFKLGALFVGKYGTGKSLLARAIAKVAQDSGVTFVYVKHADELEYALTFAMRYQPAVVFVEDIDRLMGAMGDAEDSWRDEGVTNIVNLLDGIESKNADVMTLLTTNHLHRINKVLLRPGRVDLAVHIDLPDSDAIQRLIRLYMNDAALQADIDLQVAGDMLVGQTPAIIREVVERAKRFMVTRTMDAYGTVLQSDVDIAARTVVQQTRLVEGEPTPVDLEERDTVAQERLADALKTGLPLLALAIAGHSPPRDDSVLNGVDDGLALPSLLDRRADR